MCKKQMIIGVSLMTVLLVLGACTVPMTTTPPATEAPATEAPATEAPATTGEITSPDGKVRIQSYTIELWQSWRFSGYVENTSSATVNAEITLILYALNGKELANVTQKVEELAAGERRLVRFETGAFAPIGSSKVTITTVS